MLLLVPLLGVLASLARERRQRLESLLELGQAYRGTALVLGDVVEADDGYTGEHCKSVVTLSLEVAEQLNLSPQQRRNLEFGALLHDVGKIAIPKQIINKPGPLDPDEWVIIKTHTIEGQRMLDRVGGFMREVGLIVRSHHERWDGAGYPDRLTGVAIPLEARIITCCDSWNAMRTDRAYRTALSHDAATRRAALKQRHPVRPASRRRAARGPRAGHTGSHSDPPCDQPRRAQCSGEASQFPGRCAPSPIRRRPRRPVVRTRSACTGSAAAGPSGFD